MRNTLRWLVALGCGLRLFHYLRDPSVWHDEAALVVNVLCHDFWQLLGPLQWNEAAPPLFLWLERAIVLLLGDSTFALRLLPMLAGCGSLILLAAAAKRVLPSRGAFWAVLLFAVSDRLLWHACEAKPYSLDVFVAALLLFVFTATGHWSPTRRVAVLMTISPLLIFASYPACFLLGGLWLAWLPATWSGRWRDRLLHATCAAVFVGAFALLYFGPIRAQRTGPMESCWAGQFPDWSRPWRVPVWSVANTFEVARYAFQPWGNVLAGLAIIGAIALWRRGGRAAAALCLPGGAHVPTLSPRLCGGRGVGVRGDSSAAETPKLWRWGDALQVRRVDAGGKHAEELLIVVGEKSPLTPTPLPPQSRGDKVGKGDAIANWTSTDLPPQSRGEREEKRTPFAFPRHDCSLPIFLLAPLALAWLAACVGGYPYGGSRLMVFATPALAILLGAGIDPLRDWLRPRSRWAYPIVVLLLLTPAAWTGRFLIAPWPRADVAGAAQYILAHRQVDEPVAANHWEYVYYFRRCPDALSNLDAGLPTIGSRYWVAVTAPDDEIRETMIAASARDGQVVDRREFTFTTVVLIERRESRVAQR